MSTANGNGGLYSFLELSAKVEYALLALMELTNHPDSTRPLTINEIADRQAIPERYLEHIFTMLRRGGVVQSQRGAKGGYVLIRDPWQITVLEIIALIEGNTHERSGRTRKEQIGQDSVSIERELVREVWQQADSSSQEVLRRYTLQDLCQRRDNRKRKNPMYYI